jgi:RNA polymerase sigma factor (sigma-70 family)
VTATRAERPDLLVAVRWSHGPVSGDTSGSGCACGKVMAGRGRFGGVVREGGDEEAGKAFCAREYPRLVAALTYRVGDRHVAEELAQEALLRACARWGRVGKLDSPGGWVWHVARNLATSHRRRRQAERRANQRHGLLTDRHLDPAPADRDLTVALERLPGRQRDAVVLRHVLDLSVEEAAVRLGATPDAVRSLTKRGVSTLRAELSPARPESGVEPASISERHDG